VSVVRLLTGRGGTGETHSAFLSMADQIDARERRTGVRHQQFLAPEIRVGNGTVRWRESCVGGEAWPLLEEEIDKKGT